MRGLILPKHSKTFQHTTYVNPDAPKKGRISLPSKRSTYSTFNPFILQGVEASGIDYVHATLMKVPLDDQMVAYPYIASDIQVAKDGLSVVFTLRLDAKFNNGTPVTAADVAFSYNALKKHGKPHYAVAFENVCGVQELSPHKIKFTFKKRDTALPFSLAALPVLSQKFYETVPFDQASLAPPVGAGPYKISDFKIGKYVTYQRVKNWWGEDLPVVKGLYNFDTLKFVYYYNYDAIVEGLARNEIDHNEEIKVLRWERNYNFPALIKGQVIKKEFEKPVTHGLNAFFINARRPHLKDARVREALNILFNFEWINKILLNGRYKRSLGVFNSKTYNASGPLSAREEQAMKELGVKNIDPYRQLPTLAKNEEDRPSRENIERAMCLLKSAGWTVREGRLTHPVHGIFTLEILLPSASMIRLLENYTQNLQKLGIEASIKVVDLPQYETRLHNFDYDVVLYFMPRTYIPGKSLISIWDSATVNTPGSHNLSGVQDPLVDKVVHKINQAETLEDIKLYASILDRILRVGHYFIPGWYRDEIFVAYWDKFGYIDRGENGYSINAWWSKD